MRIFFMGDDDDDCLFLFIIQIVRREIRVCNLQQRTHGESFLPKMSEARRGVLVELVLTCASCHPSKHVDMSHFPLKEKVSP